MNYGLIDTINAGDLFCPDIYNYGNIDVYNGLFAIVVGATINNHGNINLQSCQYDNEIGNSLSGNPVNIGSSVEIINPMAHAGEFFICAVNESISFDGSGSYCEANDETIIHYKWDFGDGIMQQVFHPLTYIHLKELTPCVRQ